MTVHTEQLIQDGIAAYNRSDWDAAQKAFEEVLSLDPENREANAFLGSLSVIRERNDEVLVYFGKVGDDLTPPREYVNGEWGIVMNDWGRALLIQQKYPEALEKFKQALEYDPGRGHVYFHNWGLALERLEQYEEALTQYRKSVEANPAYARAYIALGTLLYRLKRPREAAENFQKAVEADPASKHLHYRKWGDVLESQEENPNRYTEAAEKYELVVKDDPSDPDALEALGRVLIKSGRMEEFQKIAKQAEKEDRYKTVRYAWGWHLANEKRYAEAIQEYQAALEIDGNYTDALNNLGNVRITLREFDEAIKLFTKAVAADPNYHYAYYNWGRALEIQGKYEEALKQYEAAIGVGYKTSFTYAACARILTFQRQYRRALDLLEGVSADFPDEKVIYSNLGWICQSMKDFGKARGYYEKVIAIDDKDASGYSDLGLVFVDLRMYREAEEKFRETIALDASLSSGHHNLAFLLEKLGRFEEARKKWRDALDTYQKIEKGERAASDWSFIGQIQAAVFQKFEEGRASLEEGLKVFPGSVDLLIPLVEINTELKEKYSYETPNDLEAIGSAHWRAWDAYQKLGAIVKDRLAKEESASDLAMLGRLQKAMGENAEAEKSLDAAIKLDPSMADALNDRAVIKAMREDFKGAIQDFEAAVNLEPHDFGYVSNLAEAYRKAKRFDEAEKTYQRILGIAPSHMDSLIGLGETYAAMGDAAKEGSHSADAEMMYQQAIEYFSKAIEYEEKAERRGEEAHTASKRLKPKELNAVYYSRGYARVSLYDAQKNDRLLWQAQNDFRKVIKYEADENFHKAKRALSKVLERLNPVTGRNIEQRTGPIIISFLAFVLFVVSLVAFFKGRPEIASPGFALSDQTLSVLEAANLPPEMVSALDGLVGREFSTQEGLLAAVKLITGEEVFQSYEQVLLAQPLQAPPELQWKPIEIGYFTLMAFGSLIFMVAGLYLQQISKFKFGSIEIEKSSVSQISSSGALGIRK